MVDLKNIRKIYFIGIGGIGMSALARYFRFHGKDVSGYDKTETELTKQLVKEGIPIHYEENNYTILKRSDVLGVITNSSLNICVAGTHGKTTVSTMIAHLLRDSDFG